MRDPRPISEMRVHCAIVTFLTVRAAPELIWYHCPSGELRSPIVGAKLKRMGVRRGVPDLCFTLPDGRSAYMEVKAPKNGSLSWEQKVFQAQCEVIGAPYVVVKSLDEAERVLEAWGALRQRRAAA